MSKNKIIRLALDDVDSPNYGCTTYTLSLIIKKLAEKRTKFLDYPHLVRLNPNIPWKTRGNGAVALVLEYDNPEYVFSIAKEIVYQNYLRAGKKSTPAIILGFNGMINEELIEFSEQALYKVLSVKRAKLLLEKYGLIYQTYGGEVGLIGALAGFSSPLVEHTYELISYRQEQNFAKPRKIDKRSVIKMSDKTYPFTYNNYDPLTDRVIIAPHGPDPILFGIRGTIPKKLIEAFNMLKIGEKVSHYLIFKTNQGTNSHLKKFFRISEIKPYYSVKTRGIVKTVPEIYKGGHVFFTLEDNDSKVICAAYEPTKTFKTIVSKLRPGDKVEVGGGVRPPTSKNKMALNLEYVKILALTKEYVYENPKCPRCFRHMKSLGKNKGFKCDKCKVKQTKASKEPKLIPRNIRLGLYIPPPSAHRHLTRPIQYYSTDLTVNQPFQEDIFFKSF
ncbi:MAG: TiaS agmantine-binding domain-containing protein [Nitrososphaeria archaeon]